MSITGALTILLVDDESELLGEIARYLQRRGHQVQTAGSYAAGQELVDNAVEPDVLISDVRMPGGTGVDLARRVQARHPDCRIIIMTGHLDQDQIGSPEDLGAAAVLFKPFSFRRLLSLVAGEDETSGSDAKPAMPLSEDARS